MFATLITNVRIFDGSGTPPFLGKVLIEGDRIKAVAKDGDALEASGARHIDGGGATLMPGLVEGHAHLTYPNAVDRSPPDGVSFFDYLSGKVATEHHAFFAAHNARRVLDAGFTSAYSAGGATRTMEVSLRDEIDGGWVPGPRLRASGTEGAVMPGDETFALSGVSRIHDIEWLKTFVKDTADSGASIAKFILSGPGFAGPTDNQAMYSDVELAAVNEQAKESGVWLSGHARPTEAIKLGVRNGFRVLYHCDFPDEECWDLMEARKDEIFIGPSVALPILFSKAMPTGEARAGSTALVERYRLNIEEMLKRGIRFVIGGDYGFDNAPQGRNADDLVYLVRYMGLTPAQALVAATRWGGELMAIPKLGLVREGWLADLLLVAGDPLENIEAITEPDNLRMIMKGGVLHKAPPVSPELEVRR